MVRNYVRKTNRGKQYSQEILAEAVLQVQSGRMSAYKAAKDFNIPLNTVIDHSTSQWTWRRKFQPLSSPWSNTDLNFQERTSCHWWEKRPANLFPRCHNLTVKKPQSLEIARRNCINTFIIYNCFKELVKTISSTSAPGRGKISFLLTVAASGEKLPPLAKICGIIRSQLKRELSEALDMLLLRMDGWRQITFLAHTGTERPVLVICDGYKTHVFLRLIGRNCSRRECNHPFSPPHSSLILQPLDLSVMKSLKTCYDAELAKLQKHRIGQKLL
ncbi:hypothetical protein PR048_022477 [Dryococelus australis]|uniref:HTH psq-type domain-containing protein n=1 Tax=Dryococelus australis TaxID=614101 RepID=A0ABQ9H170_9NEOP|nr:hypothetical protein PR048_022477 [Dryococelus australis]